MSLVYTRSSGEEALGSVGFGYPVLGYDSAGSNRPTFSFVNRLVIISDLSLIAQYCLSEALIFGIPFPPFFNWKMNVAQTPTS